MGEGGLGGIPPLPEKLACPPLGPPLFWPQNADFVIFMQFLAIMPNLSPHQLIPFGKPCDVLCTIINSIQKEV